MSEPIDWAAFIQPLNLDKEKFFSDEQLEQHNYRVKKPYLVPKFKDEYIWSFDHTLAAFIDQGLTAIMGFPYNFPEEDIERARDAFRVYATKDEREFDKDNPFPFETIGSLEHNEIMWALDWLKEHFTALWT